MIFLLTVLLTHKCYRKLKKLFWCSELHHWPLLIGMHVSSRYFSIWLSFCPLFLWEFTFDWTTKFSWWWMRVFSSNNWHCSTDLQHLITTVRGKRTSWTHSSLLHHLVCNFIWKLFDQTQFSWVRTVWSSKHNNLDNLVVRG